MLLCNVALSATPSAENMLASAAIEKTASLNPSSSSF